MSAWETAVITTAAPDYAPTNGDGRYAVAVETASGLLFLLVAFPILVARLGLFDKGAIPPGAPDGKFRVKKVPGAKWQVTVVREVMKESDDVLDGEAEVVIEIPKSQQRLLTFGPWSP